MTAWRHRDPEPITEEKLVRAVHVLADIVERHGPAYRPLYLDMKRALAELRRRQQENSAAAGQTSTAQVGKVA